MNLFVVLFALVNCFPFQRRSISLDANIGRIAARETKKKKTSKILPSTKWKMSMGHRHECKNVHHLRDNLPRQHREHEKKKLKWAQREHFYFWILTNRNSTLFFLRLNIFIFLSAIHFDVVFLCFSLKNQNAKAPLKRHEADTERDEKRIDVCISLMVKTHLLQLSILLTGLSTTREGKKNRVKLCAHFSVDNKNAIRENCLLCAVCRSLGLSLFVKRDSFFSLPLSVSWISLKISKEMNENRKKRVHSSTSLSLPLAMWCNDVSILLPENERAEFSIGAYFFSTNFLHEFILHP